MELLKHIRLEWFQQVLDFQQGLPTFTNSSETLGQPQDLKQVLAAKFL